MLKTTTTALLRWRVNGFQAATTRNSARTCMYNQQPWDFGNWNGNFKKLKDRITPQVNFFLKWASMVLAGTGKEGKTKEVVKDREGKMVGRYGCMYVCMHVCMLVCMYACMRVRMYVVDCSCMCVPKVRVKDAASVCGSTADQESAEWGVLRDNHTFPTATNPTMMTYRKGTCHVISRWTSPSATPATQSGAAPRASQATNPSPRAPPSTISATPATPATQNDGRCEFVPRLPRDIKVDVTKCHACHVKRARKSAAASWMWDCATPPATWNQGVCHQVPWVRRLPCKTTVHVIKVDVTKCHACHAKWRGAPGVTGDKSQPKGATQYHKCYACHAKRR